MAFPEKLKALRLKNGLTQDKLGEKLYLSRTSISHYEQGKFEPNIETAARQARECWSFRDYQ